jgi:hypothetical protein
MRGKILFLALFALALNGGAADAATKYNTSKSTVLSTCGGNLQSGNGQIGCTKCNASGNYCRDYNCSDGSNGVKKGCTVVQVIKTGHNRKIPTGVSATKLGGANLKPQAQHLGGARKH